MSRNCLGCVSGSKQLPQISYKNFRGHVAPVFLGFENQDISNITYGHIHIPSISLKEIPVQREQLRLKLSYGNKKITTFNADLFDKQVIFWPTIRHVFEKSLLKNGDVSIASKLFESFDICANILTKTDELVM